MRCGAALPVQAAQPTIPVAAPTASQTIPETVRVSPGQTQPYPTEVPAGFPVPPQVDRSYAQSGSQEPGNYQNAPGFTAPFTPVAPPPPPSSQAPAPSSPQKRAKPPIALITAIAAVLVIAAIGVIFASGGIGGPRVKASLSDYSWSELSDISARISACDNRSEAVTLAKRYNLVNGAGRLDGSQTKQVVLSDGSTVDVMLVGVYHDKRSDGRGYAGLTFMASDAVGVHAMNDVASNRGGWRDSAMRSYLSNEAMDLLPEDLRACIVSVSKSSNNEGGQATGLAAITETDDKLWLFSVAEVCGEVKWRSGASYNLVLSSEGEQYQLFSNVRVDPNGDNAPLVKTLDGEPTRWWMRSPRIEYDDDFNYVNVSGGPHYGDDANARYGVVFGFCV